MADCDIKTTAQAIAAELGEPQVRLIQRVVRHLGCERSLHLLEQTRKVEANGGLQTHNGERRRTPGGVFLYLVKESLPQEEMDALFPPMDWRRYKAKKKARREAQREAAGLPRRPTPTVPRSPIEWDERETYVTLLVASRQDYGKVGSMKVTLIGRPGKVIEQGATIMTTMQGGGYVPSLPKGVPTPPGTKLLYLVYIAEKQWRKVEEALEDPEDSLIIEGYLGYDADLKKMSIFAQNVTTKYLQRARRRPARQG